MSNYGKFLSSSLILLIYDQQLQEHLKLPVSLGKLLPPLKSLKKRSLIEVISEESNITLKLQPMIMKYLLTEQRDLFNVAIQ